MVAKYKAGQMICHVLNTDCLYITGVKKKINSYYYYIIQNSRSRMAHYYVRLLEHDYVLYSDVFCYRDND